MEAALCLGVKGPVSGAQWLLTRARTSGVAWSAAAKLEFLERAEAASSPRKSQFLLTPAEINNRTNRSSSTPQLKFARLLRTAAEIKAPLPGRLILHFWNVFLISRFKAGNYYNATLRLFVSADGGSRWRSGAPHRWRRRADVDGDKMIFPDRECLWRVGVLGGAGAGSLELQCGWNMEPSTQLHRGRNPPHFSRRWHIRSQVLLFPSRYNGVKFSHYLSGID